MALKTLEEMEAEYNALTRRIVAIDLDISRELDSERKTLLKTKRDELARERETIAADVAVLHPGYPLTVVADASQISKRVTALERDVKRIWEILQPGPRQVVSRIAFYGLLVAVLAIWLKQESFDWLVAHPAQAIIITAAFLLSALIIRWLPEEDDHDERK